MYDNLIFKPDIDVQQLENHYINQLNKLKVNTIFLKIVKKKCYKSSILD